MEIIPEANHVAKAPNAPSLADRSDRRRSRRWVIRRLMNAGAGLLVMGALLQTNPLKGERRFETTASSFGIPRFDDFSEETGSPTPPDNEVPVPNSPEPAKLEKRSSKESIHGSKAPEESNIPPPPPPPRPEAVASEPRRIRVRTEKGETLVAKVVGELDGQYHILLPDGQMGIADIPAYTDEPFVIEPVEKITENLKTGPFSDYQVLTTPHYLIAYHKNKTFAEHSAKVLEDLYRGLMDAFARKKVSVHDAEFPLVAVIFDSEEEFRAYRPVAKEIQAYYEIYSNRIFFYAASQLDEDAPEVAALRRPQTVAHEGTHQILQNIGIQPRLASWPPWLVEGLAEYCSTPEPQKKGPPTWSRLGAINALHIATIRDLNDPITIQVSGGDRPAHIGRPNGMSLVEYLVTKTELTPTDYALSWAMTHYLANKKVDPFLRYLKAMSATPPLAPKTPDEHLADFRAAFGNDLSKLEREIDAYLGKMKVNLLPYYVVIFQQRIGNTTLVKRAVLISRSPTMIRQWLETVTNPKSEEPAWEIHPFSNRAKAIVAAEEWSQSQR